MSHSRVKFQKRIDRNTLVLRRLKYNVGLLIDIAGFPSGPNIKEVIDTFRRTGCMIYRNNPSPPPSIVSIEYPRKPRMSRRMRKLMKRLLYKHRGQKEYYLNKCREIYAIKKIKEET